MAKVTLPAQFPDRPPTPQDTEAIVRLLTSYENMVNYIGFTTKKAYAGWQENEFVEKST